MVGWIVDLLKELIFKPFFGESFQLIKYYSLKKTGERLLAARDLYARKKGVDILLSIGFSYPEFRQEIFDSLGRAFRHEFNKKKDFDPQKIRFQNAYVQFSLLKTYLNALTPVKRHGENGYSYLIDISQVAFYSQHSVKPDHYSGNERLPLADLRCANFRDFYMPG